MVPQSPSPPRAFCSASSSGRVRLANVWMVSSFRPRNPKAEVQPVVARMIRGAVNRPVEVTRVFVAPSWNSRTGEFSKISTLSGMVRASPVTSAAGCMRTQPGVKRPPAKLSVPRNAGETSAIPSLTVLAKIAEARLHDIEIPARSRRGRTCTLPRRLQWQRIW